MERPAKGIRRSFCVERAGSATGERKTASCAWPKAGQLGRIRSAKGESRKPESRIDERKLFHVEQSGEQDRNKCSTWNNG